MNRKKLLISADGGCFTGFSRIAHTIIENLPEEDYEVHHLAINYRGDPFQTKPWHRLYPAALGGDLIGLNRINDLIKHIKPDVIFMINDLWLLNEFFDIISPEDRKKTVCYFPVDAFNTNPEWVRYLPEVHQAVAYTEFGKNEVNKILPYLKLDIIPHGIDTEKFYPAYKKEAVATLNGMYEDDFTVLNVQRNQPRKRVDLTLRAFAEFAKNKPKNVKLYMHMGVIDQGWNIIELSRRLGIEDRLLLTSTEISPVSGVSDSKLNEIYNACDIGINTSQGEGWGLGSFEHAATGKPQIVPNSSACAEIFKDMGLLIPILDSYDYPQTLTTGQIVNVHEAAKLLNILYYDKPLRERLSKASLEYTRRPEFKWKNIASRWDSLFKEVINNEQNLAINADTKIDDQISLL